MAFNIADQSYSGTYSQYFIMKATYGMETVRKGLVNIVDGIKKQHTIARLDYINPLKPRMAVPVATNANPFNLDGRLIIPQSVDVYEEYDPRDLEQNQLAEQLSTTVLDRMVPAGFQSQLVQMVLNRSMEQYENCTWMGSLAYAGKVADTDPRYQLQFFNGFMQRFVNDPLINLSSVSPAIINGSNVTTIMDDLIIQATTKKKALISDEFRFVRLKFLMSPNTGSIYQQYLRGASFKGNPFDVGYIAPWGGYAVETLSGVPDNTILFLRAVDEPMVGNLYVGMNSMSDWQLKVMRTANANETFFIQGKWKWDIQYGWPEEIFMFTTLTAASFLP
jgi:hypothetical protein